jgi:hypothetical protein
VSDDLDPIGPDEWDMKVEWLNPDDLVPNPENPNEQDDATFNGLVASIEQDGWAGQAVTAVPREAVGGKLMIVAGEHRWRAAKVMACKVPVIVLDPEKWDQDRADLMLVKDNILTGKLNPQKFAKLFDRVQETYGKELAKELMGFTSEDAFKRVYRDVRDALPPELQRALDESKQELKTIDDLSAVLNGLFREYGETLPSNFMVFSYGSRDVFWVRADKDLWTELTALRHLVQQDRLDATAEITEALELWRTARLADAEFKATEEGQMQCAVIDGELGKAIVEAVEKTEAGPR